MARVIHIDDTANHLDMMSSQGLSSLT